MSGDDKTHVGKNRDYFSDAKSVAHLPKANRGPMTKGLRISFAIDGTVGVLSFYVSPFESVHRVKAISKSNP